MFSEVLNILYFSPYVVFHWNIFRYNFVSSIKIEIVHETSFLNMHKMLS